MARAADLELQMGSRSSIRGRILGWLGRIQVAEAFCWMMAMVALTLVAKTSFPKQIVGCRDFISPF